MEVHNCAKLLMFNFGMQAEIQESKRNENRYVDHLPEDLGAILQFIHIVRGRWMLKAKKTYALFFGINRLGLYSLSSR